LQGTRRHLAAGLLLLDLCGGLVLSAQQAQVPDPSTPGQAKPRIEADSQEQYEKLAQAFKRHSYPLSLAPNKLDGPGVDFPREKAGHAQFILVGEEHNVKQVPEFTAARFAMLHQCCGFDYLGLESDPVSAHVASSPPLKGEMKQTSEYAAMFFPMPSHLQLMKNCRRRKNRAEKPIASGDWINPSGPFIPLKSSALCPV
jgi:hypothetical protein